MNTAPVMNDESALLGARLSRAASVGVGTAVFGWRSARDAVGESIPWRGRAGRSRLAAVGVNLRQCG